MELILFVFLEILQQAIRLPLVQWQRFRGKINIQRPREPHYERALVNAVTEPIYPQKVRYDRCFRKHFENEVENPYNDIIAREVLNWMNHSRLVGIFHMNSMKADEVFDIRVKLHKQNMHLKSYGKVIMQKALLESGYEAILPLCRKHYCLVFSPELKIRQLVKLVRKMPQLILLAGVVENQLLNRNEIMALTKVPNLQSAQAELVQTLNATSSGLVQNLEAHQNHFIHILNAYVKDTTTAKDESKAEGDAKG